MLVFRTFSLEFFLNHIKNTIFFIDTLQDFIDQKQITICYQPVINKQFLLLISSHEIRSHFNLEPSTETNK